MRKNQNSHFELVNISDLTIYEHPHL